MGERVVFDPAAERGGARPTPAVPLDYGHADDPVAGAWRATAGVREQGDVVTRHLGGWRRIGFAVGVGCVAAGFAYGLSEWRQADVAATFAGIGGALVGLAVPIKGMRGPGGE